METPQKGGHCAKRRKKPNGNSTIGWRNQQKGVLAFTVFPVGTRKDVSKTQNRRQKFACKTQNRRQKFVFPYKTPELHTLFACSYVGLHLLPYKKRPHSATLQHADYQIAIAQRSRLLCSYLHNLFPSHAAILPPFFCRRSIYFANYKQPLPPPPSFAIVHRAYLVTSLSLGLRIIGSR